MTSRTTISTLALAAILAGSAAAQTPAPPKPAAPKPAVTTAVKDSPTKVLMAVKDTTKKPVLTMKKKKGTKATKPTAKPDTTKKKP